MKHIVDRLPVLVLEPHTRCNCRCVMCDIWKIPDAREIAPAELERHLPDIESLGVEWVVFSGGEPLMHSDLFRLAAMVSARGIRTTILSTGLLLARHAGRIVQTAHDVIVSLDGPPPVHDQVRGVPGAFGHLAKGVHAIHRLSPEFPVSARSTVQAANAAHLRATVRTARDLGLRSISFLAADLTSTAFNRATVWNDRRQALVVPDLSILAREMQSLIDTDPGDGFILESRARLLRIVAHFRAHFGLEPHVAPRCNAPWVSAVLEANGDVRPCFFHPAFGNTANASLAEVLNGPQAIAFREALDVPANPTCRRCVCSLYVEPRP